MIFSDFGLLPVDKRIAALTAVAKNTVSRFATFAELLGVGQVDHVSSTVNGIAIQQIGNAFAMALVKPLPDLVPVHAGAPVEEMSFQLFRFRIHWYILQFSPQLLQLLVTIPKKWDFIKGVED